MRFAKWLIPLLVWMLAFAPAWAHAAEGDPLLSVDDLLSLEDSYEAFLKELEDLIVSRGLLSESDRAAWHDAQMGDFFQNGGYGSILATYLPGALSYTREEDTPVSYTHQMCIRESRRTLWKTILQEPIGNLQKSGCPSTRERSAFLPTPTTAIAAIWIDVYKRQAACCSYPPAGRSGCRQRTARPH